MKGNNSSTAARKVLCIRDAALEHLIFDQRRILNSMSAHPIREPASVASWGKFIIYLCSKRMANVDLTDVLDRLAAILN